MEREGSRSVFRIKPSPRRKLSPKVLANRVVIAELEAAGLEWTRFAFGFKAAEAHLKHLQKSQLTTA